MNLTEKFHAIGDGNELKKFLIKHFGFKHDGSGATTETFSGHLEQLIILDHNNDKSLEEILTVIKSYYKTKGNDLHFSQEFTDGTNGEINFIKPEAGNYDSLTITYTPSCLYVTINTNPYPYGGPSEPL